MLKQVVGFVKDKFKPHNLGIIAHSMGCLVIGLANLSSIDTILLLSGPPSAPYSQMKEDFSQRPETQIDENGISRVKRSDGSTTLVPSEFWEGMKNVDPPALYERLANTSDTYFVKAKQDQVITGDNYKKIKEIENLRFEELDGDHDFGGKAREGLLEKTKAIFVNPQL